MQKHTSKLPILVDTYLSYLTAEGHGCQLKDEREKTWEEEDKREMGSFNTNQHIFVGILSAVLTYGVLISNTLSLRASHTLTEKAENWFVLIFSQPCANF